MDYDVIIIGTGFGATVAATHLAATGKRILLLERGVWWQSPERPLPGWLQAHSAGDDPEQPVQYWPRPNHTDGLVSLLSMVQTNLPAVEKARHLATVFEEHATGAHAPQPLYRYSVFPDMHIVTGSGVGGGSLVYGNVSLEPYLDPASGAYPVMADWPTQLSPADYAASRAWMESRRGQLSQVVTKAPLPAHDVANLSAADQFMYLGKSRALRDASAGLGDAWKTKVVKPWAPLPLSLVEYGEAAPGQTSAAEKAGTFCQRHGRCVLGCLPGARHTLSKTIITTLLAPPPGPNPAPHVELKAMAEVDYIRPHGGGGYEVNYADLRNDSHHQVTAPVVIVSAGTLGSTEILLRSQAKSALTFSDALGSRFSSNGDMSGLALLPSVTPVVPNPSPPINYPVFPTRGPTNTAHVMFQDGQLHLTVEDGGIPAMFAGIAGAALHVLDNANHREPFMRALRGAWSIGARPDLAQFFPHLPDPTDPTSMATEDEKIANVFMFNCLGTDGATGRLSLDDKYDLALDFGSGGPASDPVFNKLEGVMKAMTEAMGGDYVPFPPVRGMQRKMLTVFPLGGCPMGHSSTDGVVDTHGRVFDTASGGDSVHDGLYVIDAAVLPGPLAVQPTLSIVALALKMSAAIA